MSRLLSVENLGFTYENGHEIFKNVSFSLEKGDIMSVIGPNGAGKSTLMNCIAGLRDATSGSVFIDGCDIKSSPAYKVAQLVGYMQQSVTIVYDYLVEDVVLMGRAPYISNMRLPSKEDREIAADALEKMGISHLAQRPYTELSGGERQQVMIARLITQQPQLVIMDEPTSALDYGNQRRTMGMIEMLSSRGFTIMMTTHNPDHAVMLGGKVGAIDREGGFQFGDTNELLTESFLSGLYGVRIRVEYVEAFGRRICVCA